TKKLVVFAALCASATICACSISPDNPLPAEMQLTESDQTDCGALTYQNFAADFFAEYCLRCHNEQLIGDVARTDAPTDINFNGLDGIRTFQKRIRLRAAVQGDMPPILLDVPHPSEDERRKLIQWIDCGTPSGSP